MGAAAEELDGVRLCEQLIERVKNGASEQQRQRMQTLRADPDDPWAGELSVPSTVRRERCSRTDYLLTKPFERSVPLHAAFDNDASWLDGLLDPQLRPSSAAPIQSYQQQQHQQQNNDCNSSKPKAPASQEASFANLLLLVARVETVEEDANWSDKLFLARKVDVGEETPRQVVAGLRGKVPKEQLEGSLVVLAANMKKQKLAGMRSDGMILACELESGDSLPIRPRSSSKPGDRVYLQGHSSPQTAPPKECRLSHWQAIQSKLASKHGVACYNGTPLVTSAGEVATNASAPDNSPIK